MFSAALVGLAVAWSPLDPVAALFGAAPLDDMAARASVPLPIEDVEHVPCRREISGCVPARGCETALNGCKARIGHYWVAPEQPSPTFEPLTRLLSRVLPPVKPYMHIMTPRGILEVRPGFWYSSFRLLVRGSPRPSPSSPASSLP